MTTKNKIYSKRPDFIFYTKDEFCDFSLNKRNQNYTFIKKKTSQDISSNGLIINKPNNAYGYQPYSTNGDSTKAFISFNETRILQLQDNSYNPHENNAQKVFIKE